MGHEDDGAGAFQHGTLLRGTIEASNWNFQRSNCCFASNMFAVLEVEQQFVTTTSTLVRNMRRVAIVVVVQSSDFVCLKILGGTIETSALSYHFASMQISGTAVHSIEQDHHQSYNQTSCTI
jgi:hypothetical protein